MTLRPFFKFEYQLILAPLFVMLILTLLVGYSAFQVTANWEQALRKISSGMVQAQTLNNIQWQLRQIDVERQAGKEAEALALWNEVQTQVGFMSNNPEQFSVPLSLKRFVALDQNIYEIQSILEEDYFRYSLEQQQQTLLTLQENSRQITLIITIGMASLGLLLMSITALDLTRLFGKLAAARDLNNRIQEEERQRIAQELHDGVIQELIGLKRDYEPSKVDTLVESIRRICHNLKPQVLTDLGLPAALKLLGDDLRAGSTLQLHISLSEEPLMHLPKGYELPVFRIVQELLNNIKRHANASQASLTVVYEPHESPLLRIYVRDNGVGFDPAQLSPKTLGIQGVRERIEQLGGTLKIGSTPGKGTQFSLHIPIQADGP